MNSIVDTLSLPAQQLLAYLTTTKQLQLGDAHSWTAYLDKSGSRMSFILRHEMVTLHQLDYRTGLLTFLELLKAQQITILR